MFAGLRAFWPSAKYARHARRYCFTIRSAFLIGIYLQTIAGVSHEKILTPCLCFTLFLCVF